MRPRRLTLATKLAVALAAVSVVPIVGAAWVARRVIAGQLGAQHRAELAAAVARTEGALAAWSAEVAGETTRLAGDPTVRRLLLELDKGVALEAGLPALADEIASVARSHGVELLSLLDAEGRVLVSAHQRGRVGEEDAAARARARAHPGRALLAWDDVEEHGAVRRRLTLQAAAEAASGFGARIVIVAGRVVGDRFLAALQGGRARARLAAPGGAWLAGASPIGAPARSVSLVDPAGHRLAAVILEVPDDALRRTTAAVTLEAIAFAVGGALLATLVGVLLARRIAGPLRALAASAGAIARGELDARVEGRGGDEVGDLIGAFNQMAGDLSASRERLVAAERVAAWREVARRVAHEIKNPLTPIRMSIETLRRARAAGRPEFAEIFEEATRTILEEVERLRRVVEEFSRFARAPKPALAPCRLDDVVRGAIALYAGEAPVATRLAGDGAPLVLADRDQLTQVLLNLLENAREAVAAAGGAGGVRVETRAADGGRGAELVVEDDGVGLAAEVRERLFVPYFTTKPQGTGLGLAIVARIVADHGGRVAVEAPAAGGARFVVTLPAGGREVSPSPASP